MEKTIISKAEVLSHLKKSGKTLGKPVAVLDREDRESFDEICSSIPGNPIELMRNLALSRGLWKYVQEKYSLSSKNHYRHDCHIYEIVDLKTEETHS